MSNSIENRPEGLTDKEEELAEWLTEWANKKLRPMYEAYPDAGKVIPAFLFGIKYVDDLRGLEVWELAFMASKAGLSGAKGKAGAIRRGIALAPYVCLRQDTDTAWEKSLKALIEELETNVMELKEQAEKLE